MAELMTAARPYARAIFEMAGGDAPPSADGLEAWATRLETLEEVVRYPQLASLVESPRWDHDQISGVILAAYGRAQGESPDSATTNLVRLLAENDRLSLLPQIREQFLELKRASERSVKAVVTAAQTLSEEQQSVLREALQRRLDREVELEVTLDESLIGGAVIHAGDLVIDGSLRGRMEKLASTLAR